MHGSGEPLTRDHGNTAFEPVLCAVAIPEANANGAESALPSVFQVVARARQIVRVIVQMLVDRAPEPGMPVALEPEIPFVRELQDCAMRVRLQVETERHVKASGAEVEPPDVARTGIVPE